MAIQLGLNSLLTNSLNIFQLPQKPTDSVIRERVSGAAGAYCLYCRNHDYGLAVAAAIFSNELPSSPTNWDQLEWDITNIFECLAHERPMPRRLTAKSARNALFIASNGRCSICGKDLEDSFHADHVEPWSLTGVTNLHDMQAVCASCNFRKGAKTDVK